MKNCKVYNSCNRLFQSFIIIALGFLLFSLQVFAGKGDTIAVDIKDITVQCAAPIATKSPNTTDACVGNVLSVTYSPTGAEVGCTYSCNVSSNGGGTWAAYTNAANYTVPAGATTVEFRGEMSSCTGCTTSNYTTVNWTILNPAVLTPNPNVASVCSGEMLTATVTTAGTGGTAGYDQYRSSTNGGGTWTVWSTTMPNFAAVVGTNEIQTARFSTGTGCTQSVANTYSWTVVAQPTPVTYTASPVGTDACIPTNIVITQTAPGSGGTGAIADQYRYSLNNGTTWTVNWTNWSSTFSFADAPPGQVLFEMQRTANGTGCVTGSSQVTYTTLIPAVIAKAAAVNVATVCAGVTLTATLTTAGSGGTAPASDQYSYSTNGGVSWSPWSTTIPSFAAVVGTNEIQAARFSSGTGCTQSTTNTILSWTVVAQPTPVTYTASPVGTDACIPTNIVITQTAPGSGGTGAIADQYRYSLNNGTTWTVNWTNWSSPFSFADAPPGQVLFEMQRTANGTGCVTGSSQVTYTTLIPAVIAKAAAVNVATVCAGITLTATLTTAGSGGTAPASDQYSYSINGGVSWSPWSTTIPSFAAVVGTNEIQAGRFSSGTGCTQSTTNTILSWTVVAQPTPVTYTTTPAGTDICLPTPVTVTQTAPGSGGTGATTDQYRTSNNAGSTWTAYAAWASPKSFVAAAPGSFIFEMERTAAGTGCNTATSEISYQILIAAVIVASPNVASVCAGENLTVTVTTAGSGGTAPASDQYRFTTNGGTTWSAWSTTIPSFAAVTGTNEIQVARFSSGTGCTQSASTTISWTVAAQPVPVSYTSTPVGTDICLSTNVVITQSAAGSGGTGVVTDQYRYSNNNGASWAPNWTNWASPKTFAVAAPGQVLFQMQRTATGTGCVTGTSQITYTTLIAAVIAKAPSVNVATVCAGTTLTLTVTTPGSGGTAPASDQYRYTTNGGTTWSAWSSTIPSFAAVVGTNEIQVARFSSGTGCTQSTANLLSWVVDAQPTGPTSATPTPNIPTVCSGTNVSATFVGGAGGVGCVNQYQYSLDGFGIWLTYTSGTKISTTGHTLVQIQACRSGCTAGCGCTGTPWVTLASWTVNPQPAAATINVVTPNAPSVCMGDTVSATFNAGSGGVGCADKFQYSYDGTGTWTAYVPGTPILTKTHVLVQIETERTGCTNGAGCNAVPWTILVSWNIAAAPSAPTANVLNPDLPGVCVGTNVSATLNAGSGGIGCSDEFQYGYDTNGVWTPYVGGTSIPTTGHTIVQIQSIRSNCTIGLGCTCNWTTIASWTVQPQPTSPTLNIKIPNLDSICNGQQVSATFDSGVGGIGCSNLYQYRYDGSGSWNFYSPGNNINSTGHNIIQIIGSKTNCSGGSGCVGSTWKQLANWNITSQPITPTLNNKSPNLAKVCSGQLVSATFNSGSGGIGCSDEFQYRLNGSGAWINYIPGNTINTTSFTLVEIHTQRGGCNANTGCDSTGWVTLASWTINPQPVVATIKAQIPNIPVVCSGGMVSATFNAGSGGVNCSDQFQYSFDSLGLWNAYFPGSNINSSGHTSIQIQGQRGGCQAGSGCITTGWSALCNWSVVAQPIGPTLDVKTPNLSNICEGEIVSATFNAGNGGVGCRDTFQYNFDGSPTWQTYIPGNNINTSGHTLLQIEGQRSGCNPLTGCTGTAWVVLVSWNIVSQPVAPSLNVKSPNLPVVCDGQQVFATFNAGSGGVGCSDQYQYCYDGSGMWIPYMPGTNISTSGHTQVQLQCQRTGCEGGTGCNGTPWVTVASWNINPQPISPVLKAKTPNISGVCVGTPVSATFISGSGGVGCTDFYQYRYDGTGIWVNYTPGNPINTAGKILVEIRTERSGCTLNAGCSGTSWITAASWTVNQQSTAPTLDLKTPNLATVCSGQMVSATFNPGTGGVGCRDTFQYSFDGSGIWNIYTSADSLNTTGHTLVEIQGQRSGCEAGSGCNNSSWNTLASWTVVAQPVGPTVNVISPNLSEICNGQSVSATFNAGSGGSGCTDQYQYCFDSSGTWINYSEGVNINTTGYHLLQIRGQRTGCLAGSGCVSSSWATLASWNIEPQPSVATINVKTPNLTNVCVGVDVSATFNSGTGGVGCTNQFQYSYDGSNVWNTYTPGNNIPTVGHTLVEIQSQRTGCTIGAGCTGTPWTNIVSWTIIPTPINPTLNGKSPNLSDVCNGQMVSAIFNPGSNGVGCTDQFQYSFDSSGVWNVYNPGSNLSSTGHILIVIQGQRSGCSVGSGCVTPSWVTLSSWNVQPQPVSPSLSVKSPNIASVCSGMIVSATFNAGTGGYGCTDQYQYKFVGAGNWNTYIPGTSINTSGQSLVEIQGCRSGCALGSGCAGTPWIILASWNVQIQPIYPTLNTKTPNISSVCEGQQVSATFIAGSGGINCSDQYQYGFDGSGSWTAYIPGTSINTMGHTSLTIQVQRGGCDSTSGCSSTGWVSEASWTIEPQPVGPTIKVKTPNQTNICSGQPVSATFNSGTGGVGCTDQYRYRYDSLSAWLPYTQGMNILTSGKVMAEIQGCHSGCNDSVNCSGTSWVTLASWTIYPHTTAPTLSSKTPNTPQGVCSGSNVAATFNPGSGGLGCTNTYQYSYDSNGVWLPYNQGDSISTTGHTLVQIQGQYGGCSICNATSWVLLSSWDVQPQPIGPTLNEASPTATSCCAGNLVQATFNQGSGGIDFSDQYQYSYDSSGNWISYTPGTNIATLGHTFVEIEGQRGGTTGSGCTPSAWTIIKTWNIQPAPVNPTLSIKVPNESSICDSQVVSAEFNSGSGGVGCSDQFEYNGGITYTPGSSIPTKGYNFIYINGRRAGCELSSDCQGSKWDTLASWIVYPIPLITQIFSPDTAVCKNNSGKITAQTSIPNGSITWYDSNIGGMLLGTTQNDQVWITQPLTITTTFYAEANDANCTSISRTPITINVEVICSDIVIPNLFTPNNDGKNDYWEFDMSIYRSKRYG